MYINVEITMEIIYDNINFKNIKCPLCGTKVNLIPNTGDIKIRVKGQTDPYGVFCNFLSSYLSNYNADKLANMLVPIVNSSDTVKRSFISDIKKLKRSGYEFAISSNPHEQSYMYTEYSYECPVCKRTNVFYEKVEVDDIFIEHFNDETNVTTYVKMYGEYPQYISVDKNKTEIIDIITKLGYVFNNNGSMI